MSGRTGRPESRAPLPPGSIPPEINHAVISGRLSADPQPARSPAGDPVALLRIEVPVADPDRPQGPLGCAGFLVEVPGERAGRAIEQLQGGSPVLAAGRLSERWMIEGGHTSRRGVIVATLVQASPLHEPLRALLAIGDDR